MCRFQEAIGRAAFAKFDVDDESTDADKLNELLTLLVASRVGTETGVHAERRAPASRGVHVGGSNLRMVAQ